MAKEFLKLPLNAEQLTSQQNLKRCTLSESVADMLHLITTSHFGEFKQDESFGNELWERDFEAIDNVQVFREELAGALEKSYKMHERRLNNIKVSVEFDQVMTKIMNRRIKQRIRIQIQGTLKKTNEDFSHKEVFFIGPLSYY